MKRGLGKGLNALFSIYNDEDEKEEEVKNKLSEEAEKAEVEANRDKIVDLDIRKIDPNKNQPRKRFDAGSLKELAESIKQHGVIQPIIVNAEEGGKYTIIAGERRFRASIVAGKNTIPAIIRNYTEREVKEVSLVENLQREDLNPIEAAKAIKELMDAYNMTQDDVADKIGKSRPLVANTLRLLSLCNEVIELIQSNKLSAGHGKCLVGLSEEKQKELANYTIENKLTVRDLENVVKDEHTPKTIKIHKEKVRQSIELKELCHRMQRLFGTKVKITGDDKKGSISIAYFNGDDLDRISNFISKLERK